MSKYHPLDQLPCLLVLVQYKLGQNSQLKQDHPTALSAQIAVYVVLAASAMVWVVTLVARAAMDTIAGKQHFRRRNRKLAAGKYCCNLEIQLLEEAGRFRFALVLLELRRNR
jgi:hypothetical protein